MVQEVMQQLDFSEAWEKAELRLAILDNLATVFGEVQLYDDCRCAHCGGKVRCIVNGWAIFWCDRCGWYADQKWLLEGYDERDQSDVCFQKSDAHLQS